MASSQDIFVRQAIACLGLSENNGDNATGTYRQIVDIAMPGYVGPWCAAFVSSCAKIAGMSHIIEANSCAYAIGDSILRHGGTCIPGPASDQGTAVTPMRGDVILYASGGKSNLSTVPRSDGTLSGSSYDNVCHVGIVTHVNYTVNMLNTTFTTIEGNSGDKVSQHQLSVTKNNIYYLARPKWSMVPFTTNTVIQFSGAGSGYSTSGDVYNGSTSVDGSSIGNNGQYSYSGSGTIIQNDSGLVLTNDVLSDNPSTRRDMTIRGIGYIDTQHSKFTTNNTGCKLSVINYTTVLGNLYDRFAEYYPDGYTADTSHLTGNIKIVIDHFIRKGLNVAASCGICGCIFARTGINTQYHHSDGVGIYKWLGTIGSDMVHNVSNWSVNLSGQLDYLYNDLLVNYQVVYKLISDVSISATGASQCANRFSVSYNAGGTNQNQSDELYLAEKSQQVARDLFKKVVITPNLAIGTDYSMPVVSIPGIGSVRGSYAYGTTGNSVTGTGTPTIVTPTELPNADRGTVITIPTENQSGIDTAFTNYSYWYSGWHRQSPQKKLAIIWNEQYGRSSNRGIATIADYYLVAVASTFGSVGCGIKVNLANGNSFKGLIADIKSSGDSNYTVYGHISNGKLNVIEWETVHLGSSGVLISGVSNTANPIDLTGWRGSPVVSIQCLGKIFDLSWG